MVVIEHYTTRPDGVDLDKAYSDKGHFILVDGVEEDRACRGRGDRLAAAAKKYLDTYTAQLSFKFSTVDVKLST